MNISKNIVGQAMQRLNDSHIFLKDEITVDDVLVHMTNQDRSCLDDNVSAYVAYYNANKDELKGYR
jgi:hypothetical protein